MRALLSLLLFVLPCLAAKAGDLLVLVSSNNVMPMAHFDGRHLDSGILKDLGLALSAELGRDPRFVIVSAKRLELALEQGEGDVTCNVMPGWIRGQFGWSIGLIPNAGIIIAHPSAPPVRQLEDLRGQRLGTVLGYFYPGVEAVLGKDFPREDARSPWHELEKLEAGRTQYAVYEKLELDYRQQGRKTKRLRTEFTYEQYKAHCAFSLRSRIPQAELQRAATALRGPKIEAIMAQYR